MIRENDIPVKNIPGKNTPANNTRKNSMGKQPVIEILFPELCNLYGDMGNADYLMKGLDGRAEFIRTSYTDKPAFADTDVDMIYIGSMTENSQALVIEKVTPYKERLEELIEKGAVILATGNGQEIFYDNITAEDGTSLRGLGIVPYHAERKLRERHNSLYVGSFTAPECGTLEITGYTSRFTYVYGIADEDAMFRNIRGTGNEPESSSEGFRKNNLIGTNLLGPLLVMNPDLTKYIFSLIGAGDAEPAFYEDARKAYEVRKEEYMKAREL